MAYAAVISLKQTIMRLVCCQSPVFRSSGDVLQSAFEMVLYLQEVLERLDSSSSISSESLNDLDGEIRGAVNKIEDLLEFHELSYSEIREDGGCPSEEILQITEGLKKMQEEYIKELDYPSPEDGNRVRSKTTDGYFFDFLNLTKIGDPHSQKSYHEFNVFALTGRAGTCRSILARSVVDDPDICGYFRRLAWVTVGPKYEEEEIHEAIRSQLHLDQSHSTVGSKCLIVLDDVHNIHICESVRSSFLSEGDRMLVTTGLREVARSAMFNIYTMSILNKEQSWELLRKLVFNQRHQVCPLELEETGKTIAENCRGLSLEIVKVALFLSKAEKTLQIWKGVAAAAEEEKRKALAAAQGEKKALAAEKESEDGVEFAYDEMKETSKVSEDLQLRVGDENKVFSIITEVLGLSYAIDYIKMNLFPIQHCLKLEIISLFGMAGIGKTTRAKERFDDPSSYFDHRVWVTLGPRYRPERMLDDILAQIDPDIDKMRKKGAQILYGKKCLIVLDDVWSKNPLCCLNNLFPGVKFEIWLTTRLKEVAHVAQSCHEMPFLNKDESWSLLCELVFGESRCPPELEKPGKLIAENCDGLPLMIVTVASLLVGAEKTADYWNKVANKENSVFEIAYDKILEVLYPSYQCLPQHLKPCFLFMGIFPQNYEISTSKLVELWNYDQILERNWSTTVEIEAKEYLEKLASRSLLVVGNKNYSSNIKTCRLHSVFLYLCVKEARKNKFFHVLNKCVDCLAEDMESQRRLCIQNNVLFGIRAAHDSMASVSTARSLLCTGRFHEYPVPICLGLGLLKVLYGLSIRLYEFPIEVLDLVNLRYLALTYDGKLPPSVSKLKNLECLIVRRHLCTIMYGAPLYLPVEIWDMKKLKHLQVMGGVLPEPCGAVLPNLLVLLDVSAQCCTESVLRGTCNLQKLGIQIQLAPDASKTLFSFSHISHLNRLESLKFIIMNPELRFEVVHPPAPHSMFTSSLIKLSLSGIGYPWEYMSEIALIPFLEVLKLRCYAFRGPKWQMHEGEFRSLRYLLLEDSDLVYWRVVGGCFPLLEHLVISHCYQLEAVPGEILFGSCRVKLVDCNVGASLHLAMQKSNKLQCSWPTMQENLTLERSRPTMRKNKNAGSSCQAIQENKNSETQENYKGASYQRLSVRIRIALGICLGVGLLVQAYEGWARNSWRRLP